MLFCISLYCQKENTKHNFFETASYLYEEPENLIKQECREPMQYNAIIRSIESVIDRKRSRRESLSENRESNSGIYGICF